MASEVGSDIALIQDEDMLRKMWQQTEDFGKKKEIRMRMYKLREQRLKEFYTTGEMIQTETTSKRSSTRTHTESITDQGFMTMKTKEIRDSESPTEDYQRQSTLSKNYFTSPKNDESDDNKGSVQIELTSSVKPNEVYLHSNSSHNSFQTSVSSSTSSKWESKQTNVSVSEEVQKADVDLSSKCIINEQNNVDNQLTYNTSVNQSNNANIDSKISESVSIINYDTVREDNSQNLKDNQKVIETYTIVSSGDVYEPVSDNTSIKINNSVDNTYASDISTIRSENVEKVTDNKIINELQKLDSYLSTQQSVTDFSTTSNVTENNDDKIINKVDTHSLDLSKENTEGQYITTYQNSYQQPKISVDLSPSHEAFARSLRSTPERSSPSPCKERSSPERRLKSVSPEKYRASPEKSVSPTKSFKSASRRKLSSTQTKDLSKKRANTPTRGEKYDSSDDSDCSGATHGTYDKYKGNDAKRTLFKEETKITSTTKNIKNSSSTSPVRREKSPGYSSEGSVGKEILKSSNKAKHSSHESSPERSAFKPVKNYKAPQAQPNIQDRKIVLKTQKEDVDTYKYISQNNEIDVNNYIKIIKPETEEEDFSTNEVKESSLDNSINDTLNKNNKSFPEKITIKEQVTTSFEQVDNAKNQKAQTRSTEINRQNREKSPTKTFGRENKVNQEQFIENEKINITKENTKINNVITVKPKEKSPVKDVKLIKKDTLTSPTTEVSDKTSYVSQNKSTTFTKKKTSVIPSPIVKKAVPSSLEKTPSKKNLIQKDSKENLLHKTVKKDLSREKIDIKIIRNDSKSLIHKNSKESITPKSFNKKPSQELLVDKKTTISYRNKITSPESRPKIQEQKKTIEKKDSATKLKPSISPQSSQKKLGVGKSVTETKIVIDSKRNTENINVKKVPSTNVLKPKTFTPTKTISVTTPSKVTKVYSKTISTSPTTKPSAKKTIVSPSINKNVKVEITKSVERKTKDLENELPPDNFESDTDLDDSTEKKTYLKNNPSYSSSSSSASEDEDEEDRQKIEELDNMRIKAEEEYGKKMTNKDGLLNVIVQLPPSSRESSPEYSARFGQPYCSVSDDASLPRYADVVSEPEDVNDYKLSSNRYNVVTDLDDEFNVTVADRVSKFLNNANKQEELRTTEIPQSPQAVRKTKQIFESIAKGQVEETDINVDDDNDDDEKETVYNEMHDTSKSTDTQTCLLTRKISGASDYKSRKDFFENRKSNNTSEKVSSSTPQKIIRSSTIKDRRASFESKADKKTPLKDKTNVPRTKSPESKNSSPERCTKSPPKVSKTEVFDVKVEEINKARRLSGSKTVKDRTATFEKNELSQKSAKENKSTPRRQSPSSTVNMKRISETYTKSTVAANKYDNKTSENVLNKRVTSPNRSNKSPERTMTITNKVNEITNRKTSTKSPDRKTSAIQERVQTKSPDRKTSAIQERVQTKSPERNSFKNTKENNSGNRRTQDTFVSSGQRTTITSKTEVCVKSTSTPKTALITTKSTTVNNTDDEVKIEEIFDLHVLEIMLEKAVGYDRRRRIRAQIRIVKRQLETEKETTTTTRVTKNIRGVSPVKPQKQNNVPVDKIVYVKKTEVKKQRSPSPQKIYVSPVNNQRSPSPQKTLRSVEETRSPSPQKILRSTEKNRSPSPQKSMTPVEKNRSPSPQKEMTSVERVRSPSPRKMTVTKQQESKSSKNEKSIRNSTITSTTTTVTSSTKVRSEQSNSNVFQEQNVTDLITSSYGVGPTDDNGRPLFGLRALRKTNTNQSIAVDDSSSQHFEPETSVSDNKGRSLFGLKALQSENKCVVQESKTVYQNVSEEKGVDQLITDHKGKPLFGLKALQSIGKNEEKVFYEDMPEPPVSPQLKELVLKHEKHVKESSKLEAQPRQKPKAKFRDSFILDTKDEGLYTSFEENEFADNNSKMHRSLIEHSNSDRNNETVVKSKSQSTVFQSKSVMRSDGSGNVSVTQEFVKGELSSMNDEEPSGKVVRGHYDYQSPKNADAKKGIAKVTTVTAVFGSNDNGPEITEVTEEVDNSNHTDGNSVVKRSRTNDKFESIQKRFSQEKFEKSSRRSSQESNRYEKTDEPTQSPQKSNLVRGDSIRALQNKFQQATVSSSLKQNKPVKSEASHNVRQVEEKTVSSKVTTSKNNGATSFLDNNSRVTGVQDVLTRMRNADLVQENGDTDEDVEARALLNKFLGASVILHGMEHAEKSPGASATKPTSITSSASLVNQVEKQRTQNSSAITSNLDEQELDNIWDEKQLQILLDSCPDYDQRRKIRARLRQIMAEHKACADVVALANADGAAASSETNEVIESKSTSVSNKTENGSYVKTEVHTRTTTSSNRLTKANSVSSASPFAKFQQLDRQNSAPNSQTRPCYKFTDPALARSASSIKDRLLSWVKAQTKEYKNLQITNFSTSWSDGLAFCALIHHFYPEAFDYDKLKPENRRENFEIAFRVAEDEAGIAPLLDVEDMVVMRKPDWKCVFTYVQTFYRRFHNTPQAEKPSF